MCFAWLDTEGPTLTEEEAARLDAIGALELVTIDGMIPLVHPSLRPEEGSVSDPVATLFSPPTGPLAAGASWDTTLRLFSWLKPDRLKPLGALKFHTESLTCVDCCSDQGWIAAGSKDGKLSVWCNLYLT